MRRRDALRWLWLALVVGFSACGREASRPAGRPAAPDASPPAAPQDAAKVASAARDESPAELRHRGREAMQRREFAAAAADLGRAFDAAGDVDGIGVDLMVCFLEIERHAEALEAAERLRALEDRGVPPRTPAARRSRAKLEYLTGRALKGLGRLPEAEVRLRRSVDLHPRNVASRALLGNVLALQGKHREAVPHLEEALRGLRLIRSSAGEEQLRYQLAHSLRALGRHEEADEHLEAHRRLRERNRTAARRERLAHNRSTASVPARVADADAPDGEDRSPAVGRARRVTPGGPWFVDRAREAGLAFRHDTGARGELQLFETMGGGVAWLDYDRDGDADLYLVSGQALAADATGPAAGRNRLYRNDAGRFVDVTREAAVAGRGPGLGAAVGDIDNDGFPDLYVISYGPNVLYRNRGDGSFDELRDAGVEGADPFSGGAAFADFDGDGLVDLYLASYVRYDHRDPERCFEMSRRGDGRVSIYCGPVSFVGARDRLYHNLGDGRFREVGREWGIGAGRDAASKSLGVLAGDLDEDGDVDVFVACDTTANLFYRNRGDGRFDEVGLEQGVAVSDVGTDEGGMGVALGDVDGDGRGDLLVTNFDGELNRLYLRRDGALYDDGTVRWGLGVGSRRLVGWGTGFFDAGCDGSLDLFVANGHIYHNASEWLPEQTYEQRNLFYSRSGARYEEHAATAGPAFAPRASYRGAAFADYDRDGDVDIVVVALGREPMLLRSEGPHGHYLAVDLLGSGPGGRDAVGARVEVETQSGRQIRWRVAGGSYLSESEGMLHFGLGRDDRVRRVTVAWPGGERTVLEDVAVDQRLVITR